MVRKRIALVTGHIFGQRALEGILSSTPHLVGDLEVVLLVGLSPARRESTVGYVDILDRIPPLAAGIEASDPTLADHLDDFARAEVDCLLVIGWSRLVATSVLDAFPDSFGMHPTALPVGRGQAPIPWSIIKGQTASALSVFRLRPREDAGPLVAQFPIDIRSRETSTSLFDRFAHLHFSAGVALANHIVNGGPESPQDDHRATRWPKRRPEDGRLSPAMTVVEADATVRALRPPYPAAFIDIDGVRRQVVATSLGSHPIGLDAATLSFADGELELFFESKASDVKIGE